MTKMRSNKQNTQQTRLKQLNENHVMAGYWLLKYVKWI